MREYQVRICEGLGVKFPGPTRQIRSPRLRPSYGRTCFDTGRQRGHCRHSAGCRRGRRSTASLRRQVLPRNRSPCWVTMDSASGQCQPPAPSWHTGNRCSFLREQPAARRRAWWALAKVAKVRLGTRRSHRKANGRGGASSIQRCCIASRSGGTQQNCRAVDFSVWQQVLPHSRQYRVSRGGKPIRPGRCA
jgi:hypothetical protein